MKKKISIKNGSIFIENKNPVRYMATLAAANE